MKIIIYFRTQIFIVSILSLFAFSSLAQVEADSTKHHWEFGISSSPGLILLSKFNDINGTQYFFPIKLNHSIGLFFLFKNNFNASFQLNINYFSEKYYFDRGLEIGNVIIEEKDTFPNSKLITYGSKLLDITLLYQHYFTSKKNKTRILCFGVAVSYILKDNASYTWEELPGKLPAPPGTIYQDGEYEQKLDNILFLRVSPYIGYGNEWRVHKNIYMGLFHAINILPIYQNLSRSSSHLAPNYLKGSIKYSLLFKIGYRI
jgi:hypothetical protein